MNNQTGTIEKLYEAFDCEEVTSLSWDETGDTLAMGNVLGEILIWDIEKKTNISSFECHTNKIGCLEWKNLLLSGS